MHKLVLLLTFAFAAVGCTNPPAIKSDAGSTPITASAPPNSKPRFKPRVVNAPPPPAHVTDCVSKANSGWADLKMCLSHSEDPGKVGAVRPPVVNPAWSIPNWYIHPTTGNDNNTCTTSGAPCKHLYEIVARWGGPNPQLTTSVTITYLAGVPSVATDPVVLAPDLRPLISNPIGGALTFVGTITNGLTGTFATVSAKTIGNPGAAGHPWLATGSIDLTTHVGAFVHDTTRNSWFFIGNPTGAGLQVQLTQPFARFDPTFAVFPPAMLDTIAVTDAFTIETLPQVALYKAPGVTLQNFAIIGPNGLGNDVADLTSVKLAESLTSMFVASSSSFLPSTLLVNTKLIGGGTLATSSIIGGECGIGLGVSAASTCAWQGSTVWDGDVLLHGFNSVTSGVDQAIAFLAYIDNSLQAGGIDIYVRAFGGNYAQGVGRLWGPGAAVTDSGGNFVYQGSILAGTSQAEDVFFQSGAGYSMPFPFICDTVTHTASSYNTSTAVWTSGINLTAVNLDTAVGSGGFGNLAFCGSAKFMQLGGI
jgi:hypothetical protein